jgi:hypothetical protein
MVVVCRIVRALGTNGGLGRAEKRKGSLVQCRGNNQVNSALNGA